MGPLSAKQQREQLKFQNKEAREASKMGLDEMRKQQLHELKLKETAAKANQGLNFKDKVNNVKLKEMGVPVLNSLKKKHYDKIDTWLNAKQKIAINYDDNIEEIVHFIEMSLKNIV